MVLSTQDQLQEYEIKETLGMVQGNSVRVRHIGKDLIAALRNLIGGEIPEYTKLMSLARAQATERMIAHAESLQADGVVAIRYTTSGIAQMAAELYAYGTAVRLKKKGKK